MFIIVKNINKQRSIFRFFFVISSIELPIMIESIFLL